MIVDTPKEIQNLSPKTNFTVANLGKVGNYNLYYNDIPVLLDDSNCI